MDIKAKLDEKIKQFEDYKKQIMSLNQQIGAMQEQGQAIHMAAVEIRGGIDTLQKMLVEQEEETKKAKGLLLPDKTLVAADGKTPIAPPVATPEPVSAAETPKAPVTLEVQ